MHSLFLERVEFHPTFYGSFDLAELVRCVVASLEGPVALDGFAEPVFGFGYLRLQGVEYTS